MTGFVTVAQAANRLGVTRQRIYQLMKEGKIRGGELILEHWAVPEVEVQRLEHERQARQPEPQAA